MAKETIIRAGASRLARLWFTRVALPLTLLFLLIEFFDELHYGVQGAVLPALRDDLGLSYGQVGLLLGVPGMLGTFLELGIMLLGDTPLRKRLVVGGGLAVAAAILLILSAHTFPLILLAFIIAFPASGAFVTLSQATLMDLNAGREAQMMARWTIAGSLGNLLGPAMVAGGFALGWSWRAPYLGLAVMAVGLALLAFLRPFPARPQVRAETPETTGEHLRDVLAGLWGGLRNLRLLRWFVLLHLADLLLDVYAGYAALYFADVVHFDPAQVSLMVGALMAASLVSNLVLVPALERIPGRKLVRASALVTAVLYVAWLALPWLWAKVVLALALRLTTMGWYEVLQGEVYAALPGRSGTVMAISSLFGVLGGGLVWFIGWFAAQAGLPAAMWLLLAGPLALIFFMPRHQV